jgi:DNA-binding NarL/FixJ family response regulator
VARGESLLSLGATLALLGSRPEKPPLTPRERQILALVARGLANKQIAGRLGISEKTVKTHLGSAFQRLGVSDRTQAARWAERNGLLTEREPGHAPQRAS